jgi:hypothetical protein
MFIALLLGSSMMATAPEVSIAGAPASIRYTFNCQEKNPASGVLGIAVSAEAQALVGYRQEVYSPDPPVAHREEVVYVDLVTGNEKAILATPLGQFGDFLQLDISRDGLTVVVMRQGENWHRKSPYFVAIWRPLSSPETLENFDVSELSRGDTFKEYAYGTGIGYPRLSPDAKRVAYFAQHLRDDYKADRLAWAREAIAVVDLETRCLTVIDLPERVGDGGLHLKDLAWSEDGTEILTVLYGDYEEKTPLVLASGLKTSKYHQPHFILYRCRPSDRTVVEVGPVPKSLRGLSQCGEVILGGPTDDEGFGNPQWYARVPVGGRVQGSFADRARAAMSESEATREYVRPAGFQITEVERVFAGKTHIFLNAGTKRDGRACDAIVEIPMSSQATR